MAEAAKYRAFISYSHRDKVWGDWLHKALESYRIPRELVDKPGRDGAVPARLYPIFRDREESATASDLSELIKTALEQSAHLIVICSPAGARSKWVNEEILLFRRLGKGDRVHALIVDGEPNAADPERECFPASMRGVGGIEPAAADARDVGDGRESAKLKLIAGVLGVSYETMRHRDLNAQRARFRRLAMISASVIAALMVLLAATILFALTSEDTRNRALIAQSKFLAQRSLEATASDNFELGLTLALRALPRNVGAPDRPLTIDALGALTQVYLSSRLQKVLRRQQSSVDLALFSPDGKRVLTATGDFSAQVWDIATGKPLAVQRHKWVIVAAAFSPNGREVATASVDGTSRIWSTTTGKTLAVLKHGDSVNSVAYSPNASKIVTASSDTTVRIWDAVTGKPLVLLPHDAAVRSAVFSPDGTKVLTIMGDHSGLVIPDRDYIAIVWNSATAEQLAVLRGHSSPINSAVFSPDGTKIATASFDRTARLWDSGTGTMLEILKHPATVFSAAFSADGDSVVTASADGGTRIWNATSGKQLANMQDDEPIRSAEFSHDGSKIVTATYGRSGRLWDAATGESLAILRHDDIVNSAAFSADGNQIVTASEDHTARVWNTSVEIPHLVLGRGDLERVGGAAYSGSYSPDGTRIVTVSTGQYGFGFAIRVWDSKTGELLLEPLHQDDAINAATYSSDGRMIAVASSDAEALIYDAANGRLLRTLQADSSVSSVAFSPDGRQIVTASDDGVRIWDERTGRQVTLLRQDGPVYSAIFLPGGTRILAACNDGAVRIWDTRTGRQLRVLRAMDVLGPVAVSMDGARIARVASDGVAGIWDIRTDKLLSGIHEPEDDIRSIEFSRDGTRIVTASADGAARLWDVATGKQIAMYKSGNSVKTAVFSPDGATILEASGNGTLVVAVPPRCQALIDQSIARAGAIGFEFTDDQRRKYLLDGDRAASLPTSLNDFIRPAIAWMLPKAGDRCM